MVKEINKDPQTILANYMEELNSAYAHFPSAKIIEVAKVLLEASERNVVYVIGNGGSATTASHMATDLGVGSLRRKNPVRCISLVDNSGVLTATSNDIDFVSVFTQQIRLLGRPGDILVCFSASGNSPNLIEAVQLAKKLDIFTVGITGFDGGQLKNICDFRIHIPTRIGSYGIVEDIHSSVSHLITEVIRN